MLKQENCLPPDNTTCFSVSDIWFRVNNINYKWCGGFGAVIKSYERGVRKGDVRFIGDVFFHAYIVHSRGWFRKPEIGWSVKHVDAEGIRRIKNYFLGV